jgi:hypothetical protein
VAMDPAVATVSGVTGSLECERRENHPSVKTSVACICSKRHVPA